jgi:hypothetical protein
MSDICDAQQHLLALPWFPAFSPRAIDSNFSGFNAKKAVLHTTTHQLTTDSKADTDTDSLVFSWAVHWCWIQGGDRAVYKLKGAHRAANSPSILS